MEGGSKEGESTCPRCRWPQHSWQVSNLLLSLFLVEKRFQLHRGPKEDRQLSAPMPSACSNAEVQENGLKIQLLLSACVCAARGSVEQLSSKGMFSRAGRLLNAAPPALNATPQVPATAHWGWGCPGQAHGLGWHQMEGGAGECFPVSIRKPGQPRHKGRAQGSWQSLWAGHELLQLLLPNKLAAKPPPRALPHTPFPWVQGGHQSSPGTPNWEKAGGCGGDLSLLSTQGTWDKHLCLCWGWAGLGNPSCA